jgi:hypothetical protein
MNHHSNYYCQTFNFSRNPWFLFFMSFERMKEMI